MNEDAPTPAIRGTLIKRPESNAKPTSNAKGHNEAQGHAPILNSPDRYRLLFVLSAICHCSSGSKRRSWFYNRRWKNLANAE